MLDRGAADPNNSDLAACFCIAKHASSVAKKVVGRGEGDKKPKLYRASRLGGEQDHMEEAPYR